MYLAYPAEGLDMSELIKDRLHALSSVAAGRERQTKNLQVLDPMLTLETMHLMNSQMEDLTNRLQKLENRKPWWRRLFG